MSQVHTPVNGSEPLLDQACRAVRALHAVPVAPLRGGSLALLALCCAAFFSGCHKTRRSYAPPPPPLTTYPAGDRGSGSEASSHSHRAPSNGLPDPELSPAPSVDTHGKPVSTEIGLASWYGPPYHNRKAADGSVFDQNALTVAHRTLPMGTTVRVTNLETNQSVIAKVTDRGPFVAGRTLDLSLAAAKAIGVYRAGVAKVKIEAFAHPTSDVAGRWCVQVGVFIDPADAIQLKNDLSRRYTTAKVIEFAGPTGHWVRINPAQPDRTTAAHIADSIHLPDAEPYLIRTN